MTIQEILARHIADVCRRGDIECRCGKECDLPEAHRAHVAEVLEKHMQEREAEALEEAAGEIDRLDSCVEMYDENLNARQVSHWLRDRANQYKEAPNA